MDKNQRSKTEKNLQEAGFKQSSSDPNLYTRGNERIKKDSDNGFNHDGHKYRGYGTCKDHLDKNR